MKNNIGIINVPNSEFTKLLHSSSKLIITEHSDIENINVDNLDLIVLNDNDMWKRNVILAKEKRKDICVALTMKAANRDFVIEAYELGVDILLDDSKAAVDNLNSIINVLNSNCRCPNKYEFDFNNQTVIREQQVICMPVSCFVILNKLSSCPNQLITKTELVRLLMLKDEVDNYRLVDNYIQIIKTLTNDESITLIRGRGYLYYIE